MNSGQAGGGTRRSLLRRACAAFAFAAASTVLWAAPPLASATVQRPTAPSPALREITDEGSFRTVFQSAASSPRLVLLLSPT